MEGIRDDLCSKESINELVPKVINMKRMIIKRLANPRVGQLGRLNTVGAIEILGCLGTP